MSPNIDYIIDKLFQLSPRLLENQTKTANFIKQIFTDAKISFKIETFSTETPIPIETSLIIDNQPIKCMSTSLVSGTINKNCYIVDSTKHYASEDKPNLNYNSLSDAISRTSHYPVPSLAFSRCDLNKVKNAKTISGKIIVEHVPHISQNIILGNEKNPKNLVFTHFDSLEGGAMDNASGTAITIMSIIQNPKLLETNLYIISSDEELSFDLPIYWGKGYRNFETLHPQLFNSCQKIYIIDGLGLTLPHVHQEAIEEYFPITNIHQYLPKTFAISCSEKSQWSVYHSSNDTPNKLNSQYLEKSLILVKEILSL